MNSYDSILKWAKEAKALLRQGNLDGVKTNLTMIQQQAAEETKKSKSLTKSLNRVFKKS